MRLLAILIISILISTNTHAFKYTPISSEISFDKKKTSVFSTVKNETMLPIAIQVKALKRIVNEEGVETNPSEEDDVIILPPQFVVPPKSNKTIKIIYVGNPPEDRELNYRIMVDESNVDLNPIKISSGFKFKVSYKASLYITPKNAKSEVVVKNFSIKNSVASLTLENIGNKRQVLNNLKLIFSKEKKDPAPLIIEGTDLKGISDVNLLSKSKRTFYIKDATVVKKIKEGLKLSITFDKN